MAEQKAARIPDELMEDITGGAVISAKAGSPLYAETLPAVSGGAIRAETLPAAAGAQARAETLGPAPVSGSDHLILPDLTDGKNAVVI